MTQPVETQPKPVVSLPLWLMLITIVDEAQAQSTQALTY